MLKTLRSMTIGALGFLFAAAALAQAPEVDVLLLELEQLPDRGMMEAQILDADYDDRTLTVRLEPSNETARLVVPEDAEILEAAPNDLQRPIELDDLQPGERIELEGVEVEGVVRLKIIGLES